eukprot:6387055-Prorocentrum_lima.AAC.1
MGLQSHNSKTDLTQITRSQNEDPKGKHQVDLSTCSTYGKTRRRKARLLQPTSDNDSKASKRQDSNTRRFQCRG